MQNSWGGYNITFPYRDPWYMIASKDRPLSKSVSESIYLLFYELYDLYDSEVSSTQYSLDYVMGEIVSSSDLMIPSVSMVSKCYDSGCLSPSCLLDWIKLLV